MPQLDALLLTALALPLLLFLLLSALVLYKLLLLSLLLLLRLRSYLPLLHAAAYASSLLFLSSSIATARSYRSVCLSVLALRQSTLLRGWVGEV